MLTKGFLRKFLPLQDRVNSMNFAENSRSCGNFLKGGMSQPFDFGADLDHYPHPCIFELNFYHFAMGNCKSFVGSAGLTEVCGL